MYLQGRALLPLSLLGAAACVEEPLSSMPATGSPTAGGSPTSFDPQPSTAGSEPTTTATTGTGSTDSPETGSSTTRPPGSVCGDGVVAGDEECDLGAGVNANTAACTLECKHATCGDGLVWEGVEECDFGPGNGDNYDGCRPNDCQRGPHRGDGIVDIDHESCDRGDLNGSGESIDDHAPCSATCGYHGRIFFLTSQSFDGALGGVSGGDLKCRLAAMAAGLPNATEYRAWLSDEAMSPLSRFDQWDLVGVPLMLVSGRVIADDFTELVDFGPRTGIARTEYGEILFDQYVWTNTSAFGEVFSATSHCAGWTEASPLSSARLGYNALEVEEGAMWQSWLDDRLWTSWITQQCVKLARLYCVDDGFVLETED